MTSDQQLKHINSCSVYGESTTYDTSAGSSYHASSIITAATSEDFEIQKDD